MCESPTLPKPASKPALLAKPFRRLLVGAALASLGFSDALAATVPSEAAVAPSVEIDRPVILKGDAQAIYLLVRLQARRPPSLEAIRPPLNLSLVLDRSGSMGEAGKLEYVKRAAGLVIDAMNPDDVLSIVEYDDVITVMWPAGPVESPYALKRLIDNLTPRNTTNLTGGMMAGVGEVKGAFTRELASPDGLSRVLLLSDGLANEGVTDPRAIRELVRGARADGVPISTLGLGRDYDEDLMQDIAENAGGRYYYIENPDQMTRIFAEELNALFLTVARDCVIRIKAGRDLKGAEIIGFEPTEGEASAVLGDFYGGEDRSLLVRLAVDAQDVGKLTLGDLDISYLDAETGDVHNSLVKLVVEVTEDQAAVDAAVNRTVAVEAVLAETERGQREAVRLFEAGDHEGAERQMGQLVSDIESKQGDLDDVRLTKKLEALSVEAEDMKAVALAPAEQSEYLKRTKQRLYQAKQGQRKLYLLQEGDEGLEVEKLQAALTSAGFFAGPIDGEYDASLTDAVKAFQEAEGLGVDGMAGPATMKELGLY